MNDELRISLRAKIPFIILNSFIHFTFCIVFGTHQRSTVMPFNP